MFYDNRPKLKLKKDQTDKVLETLTVSIVLAMFAISLFYYTDLPQEIPSHFGLNGKVNNYEEKSFIWLLPIIAIVVYYIMYTLSKYPESFNYTVKITDENAKREYKSGAKMMRYINLGIALLLFLVNYQIIDVAINGELNQMTWTNYSIIIVIALITFVPLLQVFKSKKKSN